MSRSKLSSCFEGLAYGSESPQVLATVIQVNGPTSSNPGDKALINEHRIVEGWVGGGCVQRALLKASKTVLDNQQAVLIRVSPQGQWQALDGIAEFTSNCLSGGSLLVFIEPLKKKPRLSIFGHSPVALNLMHLAPQLGFQTIMVSADINPSILPEDVLYQPEISNINCEYCVIASQGKQDKIALKTAMNSNAAYISMVASSKKAKALKIALLEDGWEQSQIDRICSPAGIDINAKTPAEIALSILAQLVKLRQSETKQLNLEKQNDKLNG